MALLTIPPNPSQPIAGRPSLRLKLFEKRPHRSMHRPRSRQPEQRPQEFLVGTRFPRDGTGFPLLFLALNTNGPKEETTG